MTCQWCIHYRRRKGVSLCFAASDGKESSGSPIKGLACKRFSPRKSCTTCEHRCLADEKETLLKSPGVCQKWELRALSSWGGPRRTS